MNKNQKEYLDEKLSSKLLKELEGKEDWQGLLTIYKKLSAIFPESDRLQKQLKKVHKKIAEAHAKEHELYLDSAQEKIKNLVSQGQLDDAEQATYEMLALDSGNKHFIHLLAHIQHLQEKEMESLLTLYFKKTCPILELEYANNKQAFISV